MKLTVVSKIGKEATIGILSEGNFFGEGSLALFTLQQLVEYLLNQQMGACFGSDAEFLLPGERYSTATVISAFLELGKPRYSSRKVRVP